MIHLAGHPASLGTLNQASGRRFNSSCYPSPRQPYSKMKMLLLLVKFQFAACQRGCFSERSPYESKQVEELEKYGLGGRQSRCNYEWPCNTKLAHSAESIARQVSVADPIKGARGSWHGVGGKESLACVLKWSGDNITVPTTLPVIFLHVFLKPYILIKAKMAAVASLAN